MFDSLAMLPSADQALCSSTEAMPLPTFGLPVTQCHHWQVPHCATPPITSDMTMGSNAYSRSQQLGNTEPHLITETSPAGCAPAHGSLLITHAQPIMAFMPLTYDLLRL
jgi:hypothetical protein